MDKHRPPSTAFDATDDKTARCRRRNQRLLAVVIVALAVVTTTAVITLLQNCWLCIGPGDWLGIG